MRDIRNEKWENINHELDSLKEKINELKSVEVNLKE